jgi:hypothetical protein
MPQTRPVQDDSCEQTTPAQTHHPNLNAPAAQVDPCPFRPAVTACRYGVISIQDRIISGVAMSSSAG